MNGHSYTWVSKAKMVKKGHARAALRGRRLRVKLKNTKEKNTHTKKKEKGEKGKGGI